jgi:hypothetical protein
MKKYSIILVNTASDKKIKSLGDRCLIEIKKNYNVLDYHISTAKKLVHHPEIIFIDYSDNKKVKKYIDNKYPQIKYITHELEDDINIGESITVGLKYITGKNCLIINTNHILYPSAINKLKEQLTQSFVAASNNDGSVGYTEQDNKIIHCYYDLPNCIYDVLFLHKDDLQIIKNCSVDLSKMYIFEIINTYIDLGISFIPITVNKKGITVINNINNIKKIKKSYVRH